MVDEKCGPITITSDYLIFEDDNGKYPISKHQIDTVSVISERKELGIISPLGLLVILFGLSVLWVGIKSGDTWYISIGIGLLVASVYFAIIEIYKTKTIYKKIHFTGNNLDITIKLQNKQANNLCGLINDHYESITIPED